MLTNEMKNLLVSSTGRVDFSDSGLSEADLEEIVVILSNRSSILPSLVLSGNNIKNQGAYVLKDINVDYLDISENDIEDKGLLYFFDNKHIKTLNISENPISNYGVNLWLDSEKEMDQDNNSNLKVLIVNRTRNVDKALRDKVWGRNKLIYEKRKEKDSDCPIKEEVEQSSENIIPALLPRIENPNRSSNSSLNMFSHSPEPDRFYQIPKNLVNKLKDWVDSLPLENKQQQAWAEIREEILNSDQISHHTIRKIQS